ncbi:hypothetical protein ES703_11838 [subsurface metagenome]
MIEFNIEAIKRCIRFRWPELGKDAIQFFAIRFVRDHFPRFEINTMPEALKYIEWFLDCADAIARAMETGESAEISEFKKETKKKKVKSWN